MAVRAVNIDAEVERREFAAHRGSTPAATTGNPLYPDTADRFNQNQYGPRNTGVTYRTPDNHNSDPTDGVVVQYQPRRRQSQKTVNRYQKDTLRGPANTNAPLIRERQTTIPPVDRKKKKRAGVASVALATAAHTKGIAMGLWSSAWAFNTWLFVQLPLAVISAIGLGIWYYLDYLRFGNDQAWWEAILGAIANTFGEAIFIVFGWDLESLTAIFFLAYIALIFFALLTIFITIIGFAATFCRPLSGKMSSLKWATLLLCIVGYMTPGLNLFPWILLYIWVVALYPR